MYHFRMLAVYHQFPKLTVLAFFDWKCRKQINEMKLMQCILITASPLLGISLLLTLPQEAVPFDKESVAQVPTVACRETPNKALA